jgi:hypothetical protein
MKNYGELFVDLKDVSPEKFGELAEAAAIGGWARDRSKDEELMRAGGNARFTFTLTGHKSLPSAFLFLTQKSPCTLYVPNIVSPARDQLGYDEYNDILKSFSEGVLAPLQKHHPIDVKLSGTDIDLSAQLPEVVYQRLHHFSVTANKRTGSSHPLDQDRWMEFLIASDEEQAVLDPHTLARWLVEVEGWEPGQASRLAEEYEFGRELLQRRRRAS